MVAAINNTRRISLVRKTDGRLALILQGEKPMGMNHDRQVDAEIESNKPKKTRVSLRRLVIQLRDIDASENVRGIAFNVAIRQLFEAVTKKAKAPKEKVVRVKKESKRYDAMIENPRGTVERVMRYFVTQDGRKDLGEYPAAIFQPAAVSLVNVLNS